MTWTMTESGRAFEGAQVQFPASFELTLETSRFEERRLDSVTTEMPPRSSETSVSTRWPFLEENISSKVLSHYSIDYSLMQAFFLTPVWSEGEYQNSESLSFFLEFWVFSLSFEVFPLSFLKILTSHKVFSWFFWKNQNNFQNVPFFENIW